MKQITTIGRGLKLIRVFHQLNQKELAAKLERSPSYISEIESGKKKPSYELLQQYSDFFDVPISNLFFLSESLAKEPGEILPSISTKIVCMIELIHQQ